MDPQDSCDLLDFDRTEICSYEEYEKEVAKERASILWLLSKAYSGIIPNEFREPFYRDHERHRRLKPKIVHSLANAELYCFALANIYSDPNYHHLDHHGVLQALSRKGICLDSPLTETVLVQTAPIKLSAHLSVIEGIISLYIKEVLIPDKIVDVVRNFSHVNCESEMPTNAEEAAVLWINKCCSVMEQEIKDEFGTPETLAKLPRIPVLHEIADVSDGCSLMAVLCFYCQNILSWQDVCWNSPMSLGDSIYNLQLVKRFCSEHLPQQIDFLTLEDLLYVDPSIKENVLVFVADLMFALVIFPASCVTRFVPQETSAVPQDAKPKSNSITPHKAHQAVSGAIPNLRADSYGGSASSLPELRPGCGPTGGRESAEKAIPNRKLNLSSERLRMSSRLQRTSSSGVVNGLGSSGNLRRDLPRCLSTTEGDTSHSTSDRLSAGLESYYHNLAASDGPIRSGSLTNIHDNKTSWRDGATERPSIKSSSSSQSSGIGLSEIDKRLSKTSFAKLSKEPDAKGHGINIVYMQHERDAINNKVALAKKGKSEKKTTFAALPNTTTWQQQRILSSCSSQADSGHETPIETSDPSLNIQLTNIRIKLEEKRRRIELEKKRVESLWKRERQKLGKAAFLQAVKRSDGSEAGTPDSGTGKEVGEVDASQPVSEVNNASSTLVRRMSFQEIANDLDNVQKKWLEHADTVHEADSGETVVPDDFEASIEQLNSSLCDLQADISRITYQQEHVENMLQDSVEDVSHFFLHDKTNESQDKTFQWSKSPPSSYSISSDPKLPFSPISKQMKRQSYHAAKDQTFVPALPFRKSDHVSYPEDMYAKVVKPKSSNHRLPVQPSADTDRLIQRNFQSPTRTLQHHAQDYSPQHVAQAQISYQGAPGASPNKKLPTDQEQGFYISLDEQPKKTTTQWHRPSAPVNGKKEQDAGEETNSFGFVIGADFVHPDPETEVEMAKKKELIMNLSIKRRQDHESLRLAKEQEYARLRDEEQMKRDLLDRKRDEERHRRQAILEQYRQRKIREELEKEGGDFAIPIKSSSSTSVKSRVSICAVKKRDNRICSEFTKPLAELRTQVVPRRLTRGSGKPRPRSSYVTSTTPHDSSLLSIDSNLINKRSSHFIGNSKDLPDFDIDSLNSGSTNVSSKDKESNSTNGHGHLSPSQGSDILRASEGRSSDGASDTTSNSSNAAVMPEYTGPKLFVKPTAKSNRGIITNAINTVLAGAVNAETKRKVLEEINRSESKHFLILFRDSGCQFRAIYTYNPDTDEISRMYGIGPKTVSDSSMEKFYKYNSGGKCFSQVHTKHLTVTIDAFTIPNSVWVSKKVALQRKDLL